MSLLRIQDATCGAVLTRFKGSVLPKQVAQTQREKRAKKQGAIHQYICKAASSNELQNQASGACIPFTLWQPVALSSFAIGDKKRSIISNTLPSETLAALGSNDVEAVTPQELRRRLTNASPAIGLPKSLLWKNVTLDAWLAELPRTDGVPASWLKRGISLIPPQRAIWSCGVNSAARFAAMLGQAVDYPNFFFNAPYYEIFGNMIGGNPEKIQDLLRYDPHLSGSSVSQRCTTKFEPQFDIINKALSLGRPALVLFYTSPASMHWVNIVGRSCAQNYVVLNTDGFLYEVPNGSPEIHHMMNADNCAAQRFGFIERYNSVTCTDSCVYKDDPDGDIPCTGDYEGSLDAEHEKRRIQVHRDHARARMR